MSAYDEQIEQMARRMAPGMGGGTVPYFERQVWQSDEPWNTLGPDSDKIVRDLARAIMKIKDQEGGEIAQALAKLGFTVLHTGGGCQAYFLPQSDRGEKGPHVLITDYDCGLPTTWDEEVQMGEFQGGTHGQTTDFDSMRELLEHLRGGGAPVRGEEVSQADLDLINRHRASLGMGKIDMGAGWTQAELADMARTIRETGRMANPAQLKRRLLQIPRR